MSTWETVCDILDYITREKCHGEDIAAYASERLNGIDSNYELRLGVHTSNNLIFTETYTVEYCELRNLDTMREKIDDILNDFRDKYEKIVLKTN